MSNFLINEYDEVLLEVNAEFNFALSYLLVDEKKKSAKLVCGEKIITIAFVHPNVIRALKKNSNLGLVAYNKNFQPIDSRIISVRFIKEVGV